MRPIDALSDLMRQAGDQPPSAKIEWKGGRKRIHARTRKVMAELANKLAPEEAAMQGESCTSPTDLPPG